MEPGSHNFYVVRSIMKRFAASGFEMWLAGGWAEEIQGLCAPRQHREVDLLYHATDFRKLDTWLSSQAYHAAQSGFSRN